MLHGRWIKLTLLALASCLFLLSQHTTVQHYSYRVEKLPRVGLEQQQQQSFFQWINRILQLQANVSTDNEPIDAQSAALLLHQFNLSIDNFDPNRRIDDRILFYSLRQVSLVDEQLNKTENPQQKTQEASIDVRRASGLLTNLKLAEFSPISQLRYGGRLCEPQTYGANLSLIVLVITKPDDFYIRSLIRKTWGQKFQSNSTRLYFCFGLPAKANFHKRDIYYSKEMVEQLLEREEEQFADIIQWMFEDGYYRLTIKSLAIVRWVSVYCPRVASVFKVDADVLVNYENLLRFTSQVNAARPKVLQQLPVRVASSAVNFTIHGNVWQHAKVARSHRSKFYTSFKDYPSGEYPSYAGGPWLLGRESHSLLVYMMAVHKNMPALLWEDLYVTGLVRKSLLSAGVPVQLLPLKGFHYAPAEKNINWCLFNQSVIVTQSLSEKNLPDIWKEIQNPPKHSNCTLLSH